MSKDVLFIRHLLEELGSPVVGSTTIWCDNDSSIANCNNAKISNRNKHVQTRYHYIREHVRHRTLVVSWKSKELMTADLFTKSLGGPLFRRFRDHVVHSI